MNRSQPPDVIAAQQKLLEVAQRQTNAEIQQKLELLGKQVAAAQAQAAQAKFNYKPKQQYNKQKRADTTPYSRPQNTSGKPQLTQKYDDLVGVIEELGKDVRPTYAGSKSASERLKRGLQHARQLVRECQMEGEKIVRATN